MRASDDHVVVSFDDWYNQDNQDRRWHDFSSLYAQFLDKAHVASETHLGLEDVLNQQRERRVHFYSQKCCYVLLHADQLVGFLVFEYFEKIPGVGGKKRRIDEREEWPDDFIYLAQVYAPGKGGHLLHWLFDQYPQTPVVLEVEKATGSTLKERYKNKYQFFDMLSKVKTAYLKPTQHIITQINPKSDHFVVFCTFYKAGQARSSHLQIRVQVSAFGR